ncbi:unnamed protein product [Cyclocybe aegerita]|uniref:Uncharacterized protein n=1 Tax=Cyclocybe aegerita TaxID=1973307 RepID=A0A8S0W7L4_CYCAE|nr:unnamed protein product [Cyclocybe aegerita]
MGSANFLDRPDLELERRTTTCDPPDRSTIWVSQTCRTPSPLVSLLSLHSRSRPTSAYPSQDAALPRDQGLPLVVPIATSAFPAYVALSLVTKGESELFIFMLAPKLSIHPIPASGPTTRSASARPTPSRSCRTSLRLRGDSPVKLGWVQDEARLARSSSWVAPLSLIRLVKYSHSRPLVEPPHPHFILPSHEIEFSPNERAVEQFKGICLFSLACTQAPTLLPSDTAEIFYEGIKSPVAIDGSEILDVIPLRLKVDFVGWVDNEPCSTATAAAPIL